MRFLFIYLFIHLFFLFMYSFIVYTLCTLTICHMHGQVSASWTAPGHRTWPSSWAKWRRKSSRFHGVNGWFIINGINRMKNQFNLGELHWITLFSDKPAWRDYGQVSEHVWPMNSQRQQLPCEFLWSVPGICCFGVRVQDLRSDFPHVDLFLEP